jgi:hypothetical protein
MREMECGIEVRSRWHMREATVGTLWEYGMILPHSRLLSRAETALALITACAGEGRRRA